MSPPDVSVVLAVRNEELHLESALLSILRQEGVSLEVVVVDDLSTDETPAILSRMADQHTALRTFENPNPGKVHAFNRGVSLAQGQWVCLFAGDDLMPADSLAARWAAVRDRPPSAPVIGLCKLVTMSTDARQDGLLIPRKPGRGALSGCSYLANRKAVERLFPVPETLPNEDTWLEFAVSYLPGLEIVHSDVVGCAWRIHHGNSMNFLVDFDVFNDRLTRRMLAIEEFLRRHADELTAERRKEVEGLMECEASRRRGSVIGVLKSPVGLVPKLRALSLSNRTLYRIRRSFYGLFSGW